MDADLDRADLERHLRQEQTMTPADSGFGSPPSQTGTPASQTPASAERTDEVVVMVCGSRGWTDEYGILETLRELPAGATVMHGGAEGADRIAGRLCHVLGLREEQFLPDHSLPTPRRYHARNDRMLAEASSVIAFWDGKSRGTWSVIEKAHRLGIPCRTYRTHEPCVDPTPESVRTEATK